MSGTLLCGGLVVDGVTADPYRADVLVVDGRVAAVGEVEAPAGVEVLDCDGRLVMPGFVDAHSHAEGAVFDEDVQLRLLRQGITTVIGGQDGISYAPGDGSFAGRYFSAINGPHPSYAGGGVAGLLATYDGAVPVNVAYLVPLGTVRHEVMGDVSRPPTAPELARMTALVADGVAEGAVGVSTGLDYVPGLFADADEIAALCAPAAAAGLPYVTHMRGGYEDNSEQGVLEAARVAERAGVRLHLSHFHTRADEAWRLMALLAERGIAAGFDAYPYTRGQTILGMTLLPPELNAAPVDDAVAALADPAVREALRRDWFPRVAEHPSLGADWPDLMTISHAAAPGFAWAHGLTLREIAERRGSDAVDAALDLLAASRLEASAIMAVANQRPVSDLGRLIAHPGHIGGSDGIHVGAHPHPRAAGTFASYLATYVRAEGFLSWADAVAHLSTRAADWFRLGRRGRLQVGEVADIVVVDPARVADTATYEHPRSLAVGIDDVMVAGRWVLRDGALTGDHPAGGIRAARPASPQPARNQ